jgi:hypothetical protein
MVTGRHLTLDQQIARAPKVIVKAWLFDMRRRHSVPKPASDDIRQSAKLLGFREAT